MYPINPEDYYLEEMTREHNDIVDLQKKNEQKENEEIELN